MHNLTQRQIEILKAIIEEYIETAEAVGSETLEKKRNLTASPATIRNEMVKLQQLGLIKKPHSSAGRVPTPAGMKLYVRELMKERDLSVVEEVALKERVWDHRARQQRFLQEAARSLAEKTRALAVATSTDGDIYCAGYANILDMPEFFDIDITRTLLSAIDDSQCIMEILHTGGSTDDDIHVLLGEELGSRLNGPYGFVFTHYETPQHMRGEIGVLGPVRLNYTQVVPTVRYFGDLIEEIAKNW
jgi:heat-inducible transcriptional repressor